MSIPEVPAVTETISGPITAGGKTIGDPVTFTEVEFEIGVDEQGMSPEADEVYEDFKAELEGDQFVCATPQCNNLATTGINYCDECVALGSEVGDTVCNYEPPKIEQTDLLTAPDSMFPMTAGERDSKPQPQLVPMSFIFAMGAIAADGIRNGRKRDDWKTLNSEQVAFDRRGSLLRHYEAGEWPAVAFNALILWWHERKSRENQ